MELTVKQLNDLKGVKNAMRKEETEVRYKSLADTIKKVGRKVAEGVWVMDIEFKNLLTTKGGIRHYVEYQEVKWNENAERFTVTYEEFGQTKYKKLEYLFGNAILREAFINAVTETYAVAK